MNEPEFVWVRIRRRIADVLVWILRGASIDPHNDARHEVDPERAAKLRTQGDDIHQTAEDIEAALHKEDKP